MKRKEFLQSMGLAGVGIILPGQAMSAVQWKAEAQKAGGGCALIPSETAGPFPLDLTANSFYFRQAIHEDRAGVPHRLKMRIIGINNCEPMANLRVNIWHCDKDGNYSGYNDQVGLTYCRGYQITDANGEVEFTTIFPGWYPGRICHIHFQVYVSSVYSAVSQLTYPLAEKNAIYTDNPTIYTDGVDPLSFNQDGIFSDGYTFQLATLTQAADGTYESYLEVGIAGSGTTTGLGALEPETGGQFKLSQNYPNPYVSKTTVPFSLVNPSDVKLEIWNIEGKLLRTVFDGTLNQGNHEISIETDNLGLATANYVYQLEVKNKNGTFRQCKLMTASK